MKDIAEWQRNKEIPFAAWYPVILWFDVHITMQRAIRHLLFPSLCDLTSSGIFFQTSFVSKVGRTRNRQRVLGNCV
jgi:hypothetical protein